MWRAAASAMKVRFAAPLLLVATLLLTLTLVAPTATAQGGPYFAGAEYTSQRQGVKGWQALACNFGAPSPPVLVASFFLVQFIDADYLTVYWAYEGARTPPCNWWWEQRLHGFVSAGLYSAVGGLTHRFSVFRVPGTFYEWAGLVDGTLLKQTDFDEKRGYGRAYAVTSNTNIEIDLHYWDLKYGRIRGLPPGQLIFWYDWPSMTTFATPPYYVDEISSNEFYSRGGG